MAAVRRAGAIAQWTGSAGLFLGSFCFLVFWFWFWLLVVLGRGTTGGGSCRFLVEGSRVETEGGRVATGASCGFLAAEEVCEMR